MTLRTKGEQKAYLDGYEMRCPWCKRKVSITYNSGEKAFAVWHSGESCKLAEPIWIDGEYVKSLNEAYEVWNSWESEDKE